jgi:hypothetical protein
MSVRTRGGHAEYTYHWMHSRKNPADHGTLACGPRPNPPGESHGLAGCICVRVDWRKKIGLRHGVGGRNLARCKTSPHTGWTRRIYANVVIILHMAGGISRCDRGKIENCAKDNGRHRRRLRSRKLCNLLIGAQSILYVRSSSTSVRPDFWRSHLAPSQTPPFSQTSPLPTDWRLEPTHTHREHSPVIGNGTAPHQFLQNWRKICHDSEVILVTRQFFVREMEWTGYVQRGDQLPIQGGDDQVMTQTNATSCI